MKQNPPEWSQPEIWLLVFALIICILMGLTIRSQSPGTVLQYAQRIGIQHPEIVTKQSMIETGNYQCENCSLDHNNLFGFRYKGKYLKFETWEESLDYYKNWQNKYYKGQNYFLFLECLWYHKDGRCQSYAEDRQYINKVANVRIP